MSNVECRSANSEWFEKSYCQSNWSSQRLCTGSARDGSTQGSVLESRQSKTAERTKPDSWRWFFGPIFCAALPRCCLVRAGPSLKVRRRKSEGSGRRSRGKRALSLFSPAGRGNLATRLCQATFAQGYGEPGATAWLGVPVRMREISFFAPRCRTTTDARGLLP
jgi:hypothetical protein